MTGVSTIGLALRQIANINTQQKKFDTLSYQLASGKKTQVFSGLGNNILTSQRARANLSSLDIYRTNITNGKRTMDLMQSAIGEFQAQTKNLDSMMVGLSQESVHTAGQKVYYDDPLTTEVENTQVGVTSADMDVDFKTMQDLANNLFPFLQDLLNTKDGDNYLLAGNDSSTQPIQDNGTLDAAINQLIKDWKAGTISNDELVADLFDGEASASNPNAITDSMIGYSPNLSSGNVGDVSVRVDKNTEVKYTALANDPAFRDIIVATAFMKNANLPPIADVYENGVYTGTPDVEGAPGATLDDMKANFFAVFQTVSQKVNAGIDNIQGVSYHISSAQARIAEIDTTHQDEQTLLKNTISDVEDVDINQIGVEITALQTQLQASYSVTALGQQLSLVNFL